LTGTAETCWAQKTCGYDEVENSGVAAGGKGGREEERPPTDNVEHADEENS